LATGTGGAGISVSVAVGGVDSGVSRSSAGQKCRHVQRSDSNSERQRAARAQADTGHREAKGEAAGRRR
jgi:hypothetical protein